MTTTETGAPALWMTELEERLAEPGSTLLVEVRSRLADLQARVRHALSAGLDTAEFKRLSSLNVASEAAIDVINASGSDRRRPKTLFCL